MMILLCSYIQCRYIHQYICSSSSPIRSFILTQIIKRGGLCYCICYFHWSSIIYYYNCFCINCCFENASAQHIQDNNEFGFSLLLVVLLLGRIVKLSYSKDYHNCDTFRVNPQFIFLAHSRLHLLLLFVS